MDPDINILITSRRKKRIRKIAFDKKLIRLDREETRIHKNIRQQEWVELKPPIQRGYIRYFVVRPDVRRSRDGKFFEALLTKINTTQLSSRADFKRSGRRHRKRIYVDREQRLREITGDELKRNFSEKERTHFIEVGTEWICSKRVTKYQFTGSWRYVLHIRPNIIRKVQLRSGLLDQRSEEISQFFKTDNRRNRLKNLQGKPCHYKSLESLYQKLQNPLHYIDNDLF